jgi:hypothetical protein
VPESYPKQGRRKKEKQTGGGNKGGEPSWVGKGLFSFLGAFLGATHKTIALFMP